MHICRFNEYYINTTRFKKYVKQETIIEFENNSVNVNKPNEKYIEYKIEPKKKVKQTCNQTKCNQYKKHKVSKVASKNAPKSFDSENTMSFCEDKNIVAFFLVALCIVYINDSI